MRPPSGDQSPRNPPPCVTWTGAPPRAGTFQISTTAAPGCCDPNATHSPSGDQNGQKFVASLWVNWRAPELSELDVQICPLPDSPETYATREPSAESAACVTLAAGKNVTCRGAPAAPSG